MKSIQTLGIAVALGIWASAGMAEMTGTTVAELTLTCGGQYEVLESVPYYRPPYGRAPAFAGTRERIRVISVEGEGCDVLEKYYGIAVSEGQTLAYGVSAGESYEKAHALALGRQGKTFPFSASQSFRYATSSGELPLFPMIHAEGAEMLGISGRLDAKALYGTPSIEDLTDDEKALALREAMSVLEWGKVFQGLYSGSYGQFSSWFSLVFELVPGSEGAVKEYLADLVSFFGAIVRYQSSFVTLAPGAEAGKHINVLLNAHGGTKWQTKLEVLQRNPLLFESQIIGWAFTVQTGNAVPELTAAEIEAVLGYALEQVENLAKVPQVIEARYLLQQYKEMAKSVRTYGGTPMHPKHFEITERASGLIEAILAVK